MLITIILRHLQVPLTRSGSKPALIPKKEGARLNNTLTYYMGLSNIAIFELLGQNTTTNPFLHTSSLSIPVYIL
jgi:hypothetical protein